MTDQSNESTSRANRLVAGLSSTLFLGFGHVISGHFYKGYNWLVAGSLLGLALFQVLLLNLPSHPVSTVSLLGALILLHLVCGIDAARQSWRRESLGWRVIHPLLFLAVNWWGYCMLDSLFVSRELAARVFLIPSVSNSPTLRVDDRVVVDCQPDGFHRGELVVFLSPTAAQSNVTLVKRVVALADDTVAIKHGKLYLNGKILPESYLAEPMTGDYEEHKVAADSVFCLGDNRNNSFDSRQFGDVPTENVLGRVVSIFWPLDRVRSLSP